MNFKKLLATALLAAAFMVTGCEKPASTPLKIGINPWPGYEFLYLAQELGFYEELGVPVKIIEYGSLSDVRRGYERGNLDAMTTTLIEVLQVKNNSNRDPRIFLVADFSNGGDVIIARKPITTPADLKRKRVGADTTSLPVFVLARALEIAGLTLDDVEILSVEQSDMEQAYLRGEIDAVVTYPPVSVRLQNRDDSAIIFSSQQIPGEIMDVVSAEASILAQRPEDFRKIRQAWDMALAYTRDNPRHAYTIMAEREGLSHDEFAAALENIQVVDLDDQPRYAPLIRPTLEKVRNVLVETGVLAADTSADCCIARGLD
jgi:NitT/TauT family transport system substrate-binding protein